MNPRIQALNDRLVELQTQMEAVQAEADTQKRDLNEEESNKIDSLHAEFTQTIAEIDRREKIEANATLLAGGTGRQTNPDAPGRQAQKVEAIDDETGRTVVIERPARVRGSDGLERTVMRSSQERGRGGFHTFGDFAACVVGASRQGGHIDPRLVVNAPTSFQQEGVGADGGYMVPPDFRNSIMSKVMAEDSLLARCDQLPTSSNSITLPIDEGVPWDTTGNVTAYWDGEGAQLQQSKFAIKSFQVRLNRLTALVPVTEELMQDAPALTSYLNRKAPDAIDFKVSDAIIDGDGAGQPLGILRSGATVSVAAEGSQAADTVRAENVVKMYSRMYSRWISSAVWLINQDVMPQLQLMGIPLSNPAGSQLYGGAPVYVPPGGLSVAPYGTLLGRPVVPIQSCKTVGDVGDIIFASLPQYCAAVKTGGIQQDVSMHLWFDYNTTAFRFILRMGGQPWWRAPITPKNGSNTLAPFVTLAAR